ncbi:hypothetical protein GJAV_G00109980 [Gymnothorax javanicus]|nr:hypothetical protein GJAV_G00109980 [Gymnothorax javanicus]
MGESGSQNLVNRRLWISIPIIAVFLSLWLGLADCQECRIQHCDAELVASTSPSSSQQEFCLALRSHSLCSRRMAHDCRGNLIYHSAVYRVKEFLSQHNCSGEGPTPPSLPEGTQNPTVPSQLCDYVKHSKASGAPPIRYAYCSLFGDPHLRTFQGNFQTCKVEGAWPLVDNRYLSVQVTNVPVAPGSNATATCKITVIMKAFVGCTEAKVYQASIEEEYLPYVFQDGTRSSGVGKSLLIVDADGGAKETRRVAILAEYLSTTVMIQRRRGYLSVTVIMPEEVLHQSREEEEESGGLQLCLQGCPLDERIGDFNEGPAFPSTNPSDWATNKCREILQVESDMYLTGCVFDLLTTWDPQFAKAAFEGQEDLKTLPPAQWKRGSTGTSQVHDRAAIFGTGNVPPSLLSLLSLLLLLMFN